MSKECRIYSQLAKLGLEVGQGQEEWISPNGYGRRGKIGTGKQPSPTGGEILPVNVKLE